MYTTYKLNANDLNEDFLQTVKALFHDKVVEIAICDSEEAENDETAYLLNYPANREHLLNAIHNATQPQGVTEKTNVMIIKDQSVKTNPTKKGIKIGSLTGKSYQIPDDEPCRFKRVFVMRYLVDTQIFIWVLITPERLTAQTKYILQNNDIFVSEISLFEIAIKQKIGKLPGIHRQS